MNSREDGGHGAHAYHDSVAPYGYDVDSVVADSFNQDVGLTSRENQSGHAHTTPTAEKSSGESDTGGQHIREGQCATAPGSTSQDFGGQKMNALPATSAPEGEGRLGDDALPQGYRPNRAFANLSEIGGHDVIGYQIEHAPDTHPSRASAATTDAPESDEGRRSSGSHLKGAFVAEIDGQDQPDTHKLVAINPISSQRAHGNQTGIAADGPSSEIGGHEADATRSNDAPEPIAGHAPSENHNQGASNPISGHSPHESHGIVAAEPSSEIGGQHPGESHGIVAPKPSYLPPVKRDIAPLPPHLNSIVQFQRQRRFCIKTQSRSDRACEAFIARLMDYTPDMDKEAGLALWKEAAAIRKAIEKAYDARKPNTAALDKLNAEKPDLIRSVEAIVINSAASRATWDTHRDKTEKAMRAAARALPVWPFVDGVKGFGDLGLAIIVGETGDLGSYGTKERVWKRLGLAVINGERQQKKTGAEAAAAHGYNPSRRAEIWTIADSLFRHQFCGAKDDAPAHPSGPYGCVYATRKQNTAGRDWSLKRRDNDARRIMTKALLEDLWLVWRGNPAHEHSYTPLPADEALPVEGEAA